MDDDPNNREDIYGSREFRRWLNPSIANHDSRLFPLGQEFPTTSKEADGEDNPGVSEATGQEHPDIGGAPQPLSPTNPGRGKLYGPLCPKCNHRLEWNWATKKWTCACNKTQTERVK
jgi:hypothetical protein